MKAVADTLDVVVLGQGPAVLVDDLGVGLFTDNPRTTSTLTPTVPSDAASCRGAAKWLDRRACFARRAWGSGSSAAGLLRWSERPSRRGR